MKKQQVSNLKLAIIFAIVTSSSIAIKANASAFDSINLDRIKAADVNNDGKITKNELLSYKAKQFTKLDRNNDNYITMGDMPKFVSKPEAKASLSQLIEINDINRDNRLSYNEYLNGRALALEMLDKNNDNVIDAWELNQAKQLQSRR